MRAVAVIVTLLGTLSPAHAEGPIVVRAGLGYTVDLDLKSHQGGNSSSIADPSGPGLYLDFGYRFHDQLAAGVHFGVTRNSAIVSGGNIPGATQTYHETYTPIQLGVAAHWSLTRFWIAPWLGINDGVRGSDWVHFAFGVGLGVDAYVWQSGHRVGAYIDISDGLDNEVDHIRVNEKHRYVSAGVAYRYW